MLLSTKQVENLLEAYFAVDAPELPDELIDVILAKAISEIEVKPSEQFRERALKRMQEAQRVRELKQELISSRGGKYR